MITACALPVAMSRPRLICKSAKPELTVRDQSARVYGFREDDADKTSLTPRSIFGKDVLNESDKAIDRGIAPRLWPLSLVPAWIALLVASGLTGTWSGASANVTIFSQSQSQQGATASAFRESGP